MELIKIIARILNTTEAKAQEYIDQEDEDGIIELNKANLKKKFDEGHKKASKFATKEVIDALKSEFDVDIKGETPDEIVNSFKEGLSGRDNDDITEDQIKASEPYKKLQADLTRKEQDVNKQVEKKVKEVLKDKEKEFSEGLKKAKRQAIDSELEVEAEKWLVDKKALLSEDPTKRRKQIKELAAKLAADEIEKDEDGNFLISSNGTPVTTKEGHNASLADRFSEFDYMFHFQEVQQRQSSGLNPNGIGKVTTEFKHFKGEVPKDAKEMNKYHLEYSEGAISQDAYNEVKAAFAEQTKQ